MTAAPADARGRPVYSEGPIIRALEWAAMISSLLALMAVIASATFYVISLSQISHSRKAAVTLTCGVLTAVTTAGWDTVTGGVLPEDPFTRQLERFGYPPYSVRQAQARQAGDAYVNTIAARIAKVAGDRRAADLVMPRGAINCRRFIRLSGVS